MDCRRAQRAISERMDGEHLPARIQTAVDRHVESCRECKAFLAGASRLRERARFQLAPAVPDLVEPIMAAVAREREARPIPGPPAVLRPVRLRRRPLLFPLSRQLAPLAAALAVGLIAGSLTFGGPWQRTSALPTAAALTRGVEAAAPRIQTYRASFAVTEFDFDPAVPVRELSMNVWFEAPQRFRLDVADHTTYPSSDWTPNDLSVVVNGSSWYSAGPVLCPSAPPSCPPRTSLVDRRVAFSTQTPLATDLVLPITTLADTHQLRVIGRATLLGRDAVEVELPFERATPLFPFLTLGGSWRPFFPHDRVVLWLDARDWFPLRYRVFAAPGPERRAWALRYGLPEEPAGREIFDVSALSVDETPPQPGTFDIPAGGAPAQGRARIVSLADVREAAGYAPVTPDRTAGLGLDQVAVRPSTGTTQPETLITYTEGLSWLKLGETTGWTGDAFFGAVDRWAEEVQLGGGRVAFYEPATSLRGRRLSIHAAGVDLYLETNLPRGQLLGVAASLPIKGEAIPESWRVLRRGNDVTERTTLEAAARALPFAIELPQTLPPGYLYASTELLRVEGATGVNVYFRQVDIDLGTGAIRLHMEPGRSLPPASSAVQSTVRIAGSRGRFTPDRHQLEWVRDGVYFSVDAPGLGLTDLLRVAGSLAPLPGTAQ